MQCWLRQLLVNHAIWSITVDVIFQLDIALQVADPVSTTTEKITYKHLNKTTFCGRHLLWSPLIWSIKFITTNVTQFINQCLAFLYKSIRGIAIWHMWGARDVQKFKKNITQRKLFFFFLLKIKINKTK